MSKCWVGIGLVAAGVLLTLNLNGADRKGDEEAGIPSGIVWYGVLEDGLAEAKASGKPIMLLSAAPNCVGVSGIW